MKESISKENIHKIKEILDIKGDNFNSKIVEAAIRAVASGDKRLAAKYLRDKVRIDSNERNKESTPFPLETAKNLISITSDYLKEIKDNPPVEAITSKVLPEEATTKTSSLDIVPPENEKEPEKKEYVHFGTYDSGKPKLPEEDYIPSDEYDAYIKEKGNRVAKGAGKVLDKILRSEKKQVNNGIITTPSMPEKNNAPEPKVKSQDKKTEDNEELKLQKAVYALSKKTEDKLKEITGDKKTNELNKRNLAEFRASPYRWIRMDLNTKIKKAQEDLQRIKEKDKRAPIEKELEKNKKSLIDLTSAFEKNVPLKLNNKFTDSEVDLGGNEILNIKQSSGELDKYLGSKNTNYKIKGVIQRKYADLLVIDTDKGEVELDLDIAHKIFLNNKESGQRHFDSIKEGSLIEIQTGDIKSKKLQYKVIKRTKNEIIFEDLNANNKTVIATTNSMRDLLLDPKSSFTVEEYKEPVKEIEPVAPIEESEEFKKIINEINELKARKTFLENEKAEYIKSIEYNPILKNTKEDTTEEVEGGTLIPKLEDTNRLLEYKRGLENLEEKVAEEDTPPPPPYVQASLDNIEVLPVHKEFVEADSSGSVELVKEKEEPIPEKVIEENKAEEQVPQVETVVPIEEKVEESIEVPQSEEIPEEIVEEKEKPKEIKLSGPSFKYALEEIVRENELNIKDLGFNIGMTGFRIEGRVNGQSIGIPFEDRGRGLVTRETIEILSSGFYQSTIGLFKNKETDRQTREIMHALIPAIADHFSGELAGEVKSIRFINGELVVSSDK